MYYTNERDIEVVMPDGSSIFIDDNSKFYEYIRRITASEKKTRTISEKIQNNQRNYEIQDYMDIINSLQAIRDRTVKVIEHRALTYRRASDIPGLLSSIEAGERDDRLDSFRLQDEILSKEIEILDEHSMDSSPVITFGKIVDTEKAMTNIERSARDFDVELGILPVRKNKTTEDISRDILSKHQVSPESFAYAPLSRGIQREVIVGETINTAKYHLEGQAGATEAIEGLQRISDKSRQISQSRYDHHEMYRGTGVKEPQTLFGTNGESFYERINPLEQKTVGGCGQIMRYSMEGNIPAVRRVSEQIESDLNRIANFEQALVDVGGKEQEARHTRMRRYVPNRKENNVRRMMDKLNKKIVTIGLGAALLVTTITGVNMAMTINDITQEPEIHNIQTGYVQTIEMPTELQDNNPYVVTPQSIVSNPEIQVEKKEKVTVEPEVIKVTPARQRQKGPMEGLVDIMSDEDVAKYAEAFRRGNDNVKYFRDAFVIANWGRYANDREFLQEAFKECDTRISMVQYYGDSHQLAHQMVELMDTMIKSEIEEALEEKGMTDVDMDDVSFYVTYTSGDKVKAYDIRLGQGKDMKVLARSVHMKGTSLDAAIRGRYELERAIGKVAAFDPNTIMANATQDCYRIFQYYMRGEKDLVKNGELSDIRREDAKGFLEIEGDSLDYGDEI